MRMTRSIMAWGAVSLVACTSTVSGEPLPDGRESSSSSGGASSGASGSNGSSGSYESDGGTPATRPPPVITGVAPLAGDYGTEVTITGDNLDEASAVLSLATPTEPYELRMPAQGTQPAPESVIVKWTKTEIVFKYPFPAEGTIGVTTRSGQATGGSFEPSWRPGSPLSGVFSRRELLAVVSPSPGRLVAMFDGATGPQVVVAEPNGTVTSKPFARGGTLIFHASLWVTPSGTVDGVFAAQGTLWTITDAAGAATTASTGVAATIVAGGMDDVGPYAWLGGGTTLARVRPPSWTSTGETVSDPTPAGAPGRSLAVGTDHSLYVGWGVNTTGSFPTYDHESHPVTRRLRPGQTTFDAQRTLGGGADDVMAWTRFRAGPEGRVASYYCANDTGVFSPTATWDCGEGYVGGTVPSAGDFRDYVVGWNATSSFATMCERTTATLKVGPEGQTAEQEAALFPCPHVAAATVDADGAGVFVAWSGKYLYAPKKRAASSS
jgi:hypothetical protein